jgi:AraC family transcriptional activator of mtrCDE
MELLDRLLSLMPVAGRVDVRCHFGSPWRLDEPPADEWAIRYHVLLRGEAVVEVGSNGRSEPALRMRAGDIVLFPAGSSNTLHDGSGMRARSARKEHVAGLTIATNTAHAKAPTYCSDGSCCPPCHSSCYATICRNA